MSKSENCSQYSSLFRVPKTLGPLAVELLDAQKCVRNTWLKMHDGAKPIPSAVVTLSSQNVIFTN